MNETSKAFLVIADISGFTNFMKRNVVSSIHAEQIVVRLLKSVIDVAKPPLKLAEIEGDAVFFYALSSPKESARLAEEVKAQVVEFFESFKNELELLKQIHLCSCDACVNVGKLQLKQVIHHGDISIERIKRFQKLFGLDVIIVHRMLKNSVPYHEYVMMTGEAYTRFEDFFGVKPERRLEHFEEVGEIETLVFYPEDWGRSVPVETSNSKSHPKPSVGEKVGWAVRLAMGSAINWLGIPRGKGVFRNPPL
jgi:uncharacterized protein DUF2652